MTLAERSIAEYLGTHPGRLVNSHELAAEVGCKSEGSIRVLVHRMRGQGVEITSKPGVYGGYQLTALSA